MTSRMFTILFLLTTSAVVRAAVCDPCAVTVFNALPSICSDRKSGHNAVSDTSGRITMNSQDATEFEIQVRRNNEIEQYRTFGDAFVSVSNLGVLNRARKEFDKAEELIRKEELLGAVAKLRKAIAIYPNYAVAYNNLGVLYSRLGDPLHEREALQKAISLDDHFGLAYTNFGRMKIGEGDFAGAETALHKATWLDPNDPVPLILLTWAEFMQHNFEGAIAASQKAHLLEKPHAFVHRVAARSYEQEKQGAKAISELETFLSEEPSGGRADAVRQELDVVKTVLQ